MKLPLYLKSPDSALLSLNTATTRGRWGLAQAIAGCARHGIRSISPWRDQLQAMGVAKAARAIRAHGLSVTGLCHGGLFPANDARGRKRAIADNLRAIDEAHALAAQCLVLIGGGLPKGSKDIAGVREQVRDGIAAILPCIRGWMGRAGYCGFHEVEIFSKRNWWRRDPAGVLRIIKARHRRFG